MTDCGCIVLAQPFNRQIFHCPRHSEANVARLEAELSTAQMTHADAMAYSDEMVKDLRTALARLVEAWDSNEWGDVMPTAIAAARELLR